MTIAEGLAWAALLQARAAWRPGAAPGPATVTDAGGARLTLLPGGGRETGGAAIAPEAAALLDLYLPLVRRPQIVLAQLGQSLDGRIATASGHSHYVTGPESLVHLHRLRALCDAVVVGAGTVAADDPQLTVRHCPGPDPLRVVLDPRLSLPRRHRVFGPTGSSLVVCAREHAPAGAPDVVGLEHGSQGFDPHAIVALLAARGATRILVEGGGVTVSRFLAARALDQLHVVVAPLVIGSGRQGVNLPEIATLAEALRPPTRRIALGEDMLFELSFT